jgi:hypothetical protein
LLRGSARTRQAELLRDDRKTGVHLPVADREESTEKGFALTALLVHQPQDDALVVPMEPRQSGEALADTGPGGGRAYAGDLLQQRAELGGDLRQLTGLQQGRLVTTNRCPSAGTVRR